MRLYLIFILTVIFPAIKAIGQNYKNKKIDSLYNIYLNSNHDSIKIRNLILIEQVYENIDIKKAIEFANKALAIAEKSNNLYGKANSYSALGNINQKSGNFKEALSYYNKAFNVYKGIEDSLQLPGLLNNIGIMYDNLGEYNKAVEYLMLSLDGHIKNNNKEGIASAFLNIGLSYFRQENYEKALEYYNESLKYRFELNDKAGQALCYNNIGIIFYYKNELDKVIDNFIKALHLYEEIGDKRQIALPLFNIGQIYYETNEYDKALEYFEKALKYDIELDDKNSMVGTLDYIGRVYTAKENYSKALDYQNKALKIAEEIGAKLEIADIYLGLSETYEMSGDYKNAFSYFRKHKIYNDSLYSSEKHNQIAELQTKYDTERKEKELKIKNLEIESKNSKIEKQNLLIYSFIVGFIIILFFSIIIYRLYIQKRKANIILAQLNEEILQQKEEIQTQAEMLLEINKELEKLSIVASETDNSVIISDKHGNIEWVNDGFTKLFGYNLKELIDNYGENFIKASSKEDINLIYQNCIETKKSINYINKNKTKDGREIWVQTTLTPIINSNNEIRKLVAIDSDITELKNAEKEILLQKSEIENQRDLILDQKKEITDSINYAVQIQKAIFTPREIFKQNFKNYFIVFKPRNIVSGDFYYAKQIDNIIIAAVADCTGHGVPGAFMSMLGIAYLNEIISNNINKEFSSASILNQLRETIVNSLNQSSKTENETLDGMDISLIIINKDTNNVKWSGANNPLYIVTRYEFQDNSDYKNLDFGTNNSKLIEFKPDKMPIGLYHGKKESFNEESLTLKKSDKIYLFTDGFADQFGGKKGKKYMYSNFKKLLLENSEYNFAIQKENIEKELFTWTNDTENTYDQIDDICIVGFEL